MERKRNENILKYSLNSPSMMQTRTEKPLSPESYAKVVFTFEQLSLAHCHCMVNYIVYYKAYRVEVRDSSKLRFASLILLGYHSHKEIIPKIGGVLMTTSTWHSKCREQQVSVCGSPVRKTSLTPGCPFGSWWVGLGWGC